MKSKQARVQEVLLAMRNHLRRGEFYTQEELLDALHPGTDLDPVFLLQVVQAAVSSTILGRTGLHYLFRRQPDHEDFVEICKGLGLEVNQLPQTENPSVDELSHAILGLPNLSAKLEALQHEVSELKNIKPASGHWLVLNVAKMPRDVREGLRSRAMQITGTQASPEEVEHHMVLVAAKILVHSLHHGQKRPQVRGIIPVDAGEPPHEP